ncbi:MAG: hypothetical protein WC023_12095 [Rhodocyclaceae bacterium]
MKKNFIFCCLPLIISGCATSLPRYQSAEPLLPNNSFGMRVSTNMGEVRAYKFDNKTCSVGGAAIIEAATNWGLIPKATGGPLNQGDKGLPKLKEGKNRLAGELTIKAQEEFYVAVAANSLTYMAASSCMGYVGFSPKAGATYELSIDSVGNKCMIGLVEIVQQGSETFMQEPVPRLPAEKKDCPAAFSHASGGFVQEGRVF